MTIRVAVGSSNPVKIGAVSDAFALILPGELVEVAGHDVASGVSEQPMSHEEAITGARNRANATREIDRATYGVGIESGLERIGELWFTTGWVVMADDHGVEGLACSLMKQVPTRMIELVHSGLELGQATDAVFGTPESKRSTGMIGLLTGDVLTRRGVFRDTVIAAFASFRFPELYSGHS